jgi:hypothetical protein
MEFSLQLRLGCGARRMAAWVRLMRFSAGRQTPHPLVKGQSTFLFDSLQKLALSHNSSLAEFVLATVKDYSSELRPPG